MWIWNRAFWLKKMNFKVSLINFTDHNNSKKWSLDFGKLIMSSQDSDVSLHVLFVGGWFREKVNLKFCCNCFVQKLEINHHSQSSHRKTMSTLFSAASHIQSWEAIFCWIILYAAKSDDPTHILLGIAQIIPSSSARNLSSYILIFARTHHEWKWLIWWLQICCRRSAEANPLSCES